MYGVGWRNKIFVDLIFSCYDIHFHRSPRVPAGLRLRRSAHQALQPQDVVSRFLNV